MNPLPDLELQYHGMKFTCESCVQLEELDVYNNVTVVQSDHPKLKVGEVIEQVTVNTTTDQIWYEKENGDDHEYLEDKMMRKAEQRRINKEFKIEANITMKRALRGDDDYHSSDYDVSSDSDSDSESDHW
jgi:hypothetical protein